MKGLSSECLPASTKLGSYQDMQYSTKMTANGPCHSALDMCNTRSMDWKLNSNLLEVILFTN